MILNFPKKKSYNPGGLRGFLFVPISYIAAYPPIKDGKISTELSLLPGREWLRGYSTPYTLEFTEKPQSSPNGVYYDQVLAGFTPGDSADMLDVIQSMEDQRFALLVQDARGQNRLIGAYGYPLTFLADFATGSNRADAKGFSFSFSGQAVFRAPVY